MAKISILQEKMFTDFLLFLSSLGALGLFLVPSTLVTLILMGILGLIILNGLIHIKEPPANVSFRIGPLILALSFCLIGFLLFPESMAYTHPMTQLAEKCHLPYLVNARIAAGILACIGFYAFYRLGFYMEENLCRMLNLCMEREENFSLSNLIFPLSAIGFFALEFQWNMTLICSGIAATAFALVISLHCPDFIDLIQPVRRSRKVIAFLTALGVILFRMKQADRGIFGYAAGVLALPFLFLCLTVLYGWLDSVFEDMKIFQHTGKGEKLLYLCIFLCAAVFSAVVFFQTDAFYGTSHEFDIIYTSDSPSLVQRNAFLALRHPENDLRQPLFAVFAAPFMGLPYLIGQMLPASSVLCPLLMNWAQIVLLLLSNFLLTKIMDLDAKHRMVFMVLTAFSYPVILFSLMMEQYITCCFWLILCICLILRKKSQAELPLCAAGGTLLTSLILLPAMGEYHPFREFSKWFSQMLSLLLSFATALLCFGRLDIILDSPTQLITMMQFSGQKLTALQKLYQYSGFFLQCLIAPKGAVDLHSAGHPSWQLLMPAGFSFLGILILLLSIISFVLNRKDKASRAAGLWMIFSFLILFVMGWGTAENGLILYTLYFGWAVWILLWRLIQKLEDRIPHLTLIAGILLTVLEAVVNFPAIFRVIHFACTYYPI